MTADTDNTPREDFGDYCRAPGANWSTLKLMGSPAKARWTLDNPDAGDTASRGMLRAVHCLVLEPHVFDRDFALCTVRRDARTATYQAWLADNEGKTALTQREYDQAQAMAAAVHSSPLTGPVFASPTGRGEESIKWVDPTTGTTCKGRTDWQDDDPDGALRFDDLKSVPSVDPGEIGRMIVRMKWLGQFAHYIDGLRVLNPGREVRCRIVCVETAPPYDVGIFLLDDVALNAGEIMRRPLLNRFSECVASGVWPGRHQAPVYPDIPDYALPSINFDNDEDFSHG